MRGKSGAMLWKRRRYLSSAVRGLAPEASRRRGVAGGRARRASRDRFLAEAGEGRLRGGHGRNSRPDYFRSDAVQFCSSVSGPGVEVTRSSASRNF